jgi:ribosomal protein S18 acetylase RimI-like enzyme
VTTVVAMTGNEVVGFAELLGDGELQGFLATMVVAPGFRGRGVGRELVREATRRSGTERVDLLSEEDATGFYARFPHFSKPGFRLYPFHEG